MNTSLLAAESSLSDALTPGCLEWLPATTRSHWLGLLLEMKMIAQKSAIECEHVVTTLPKNDR
ncbi:hypothetical protein PR003_g26282 [Phytophthora rubi]|uniref:Uncharacterized protein n=1 Tax=Phytophthora rubi TaxID=129364 RepID=A0A6A4CDB7_9STRA|nr:hypothetical protein PR003_g26282 [Phytophthora rubi]